MQITDRFSQFTEGGLNISDSNLIVLVGANNSGKTTVLRSICADRSSYFVNTHRIRLTGGDKAYDAVYKKNILAYTDQLRNAADDNSDKQIQVLQDIFFLDDVKRQKVIDFYNQYFPSYMYAEREDTANSASPLQLKMHGFSLTKQGSGAKAILEILVKLLDDEIKILCIDEPELALEPRLQKSLFNAIKAGSTDKKIIIATHSHHFLDRENIENNYVCQRDDDEKIYLNPVTTQEDLNDQIFRLLGNDLGDLQLPEKVLIVEGPSDVDFIKKALFLLRKRSYVLFAAGGDARVPAAISAITSFIEFASGIGSVYKDRTWIIVDKQGSDATIRRWKTSLGDNSRVKELPQNGIEYFYPVRILQEIFKTSASRDEIVKKFIDTGGFNGKQYSKIKLAQIVAEKLKASDLSELNNDLFIYLQALPA